jgi:sodium-dependent dicarboxylate transporter 2/3/5
MTQSGIGRAAQIGMFLGPALFLTILLSPVPAGMAPEAWRLLAVTALMSSWWLTQAIPIAATSLLPIVLFPLLGIQTSALVSQAYINKQVFLFLGGFIIALGIEKWGLHERIALHIVRVLGTSLRKVVLGFMLATAFLSMWISNTASTLLMTPIGLALILSLQKALRSSGGTVEVDGDRSSSKHETIDRDGPLASFGVALMLGIAWSASIGGMTTLVGTVTNVQFVSLWEQGFPAGPKISAAVWLTAFAPVGLVLVLLAWGLLTWDLKSPAGQAVRRDFFSDRLRRLGRPSFAELSMLVVFAATALLWTFRKPLKFGDEALVDGWGGYVKSFLAETLNAAPDFASQAVDDSTVAIAMAVLLFLLPSGRRAAGECRRLMDWETAQTLPWAILLLVGGGFAIADSFDRTGLASWVGDAFATQVAGWPIWMTIAAVCFLLTFLTEFATNVVVVSVILPVLAKASLDLEIDPRLLMLPAAASASCAFMLPIGTPPNAIVFSSGALSMGDMAKKGFLLNLIGVVLMTTATVVYLVPHLDLQTDSLPEWATAGAVGSGESGAGSRE